MIDWNKSELDIDYRYDVIGRDGSTIGEVTDITGGQIERKYLSKLKEGASLSYQNTFQLGGIGDDCLRVVLIASDGTQTENVALGTFMVTTPEQTISPLGTSGQATCLSMLQVLEDEKTAGVFTVRKNTQVIPYCVSLIESRGLSVSYMASDATLASSLVFKDGESMLDVLTALCSAIGYDSPGIDGYGTIQLNEYRSPDGDAPVKVYDDGSRVAFLENSHEFDWFSVPNKVNVISSTRSGVVVGSAENRDPANPYSIPARGRIITNNIEVEGISTSAAAAKRARQELLSATAVESFDVTHLYDDSRLKQTIRLAIGDLDVTGQITTQTLNLDEGCTVTDHARVFRRIINP